MNPLDLLAYIVLTLTLIFGIIPILGMMLSGPFTFTYKECFKSGLIVLISMLVAYSTILLFSWSLHKVLRIIATL